jgi:hypothetical protein
MKTKQLDTKLAAQWLGEAWGEHIPQSHIRIRKGWLFVRYPNYIDDRASLNDPTWDGIGFRKIRKGWEKEVECLEAPRPHPTKAGMVISNDISGDRWSGIPYEDSPFIPHNHKRVSASIDQLNHNFAEVYEEVTGLLSEFGGSVRIPSSPLAQRS